MKTTKQKDRGTEAAPTLANGQIAEQLAKRIVGKVRRHIVHKSTAKELYKSADVALDAAIALGAPIDQPFVVRYRDRKNMITRTVVIQDLFEKSTTIFRAKSFHRYEVADFKPPKAPKAASRSGTKKQGAQKA